MNFEIKFKPGHEEGVHPVDLRHHGVDDGLAVDRARVEENVKQGLVDEAPQLGNASEGQWPQTRVSSGVFSVKCPVPVDRQEFNAIGTT